MLPLLAVVIFILIVPFAIAGFSLAPWVPTRERDFSRIVTLAHLTADDTFLELGSGDGRVCAYVAAHSSARCIGIERAWPLHVLALARARTLHNPRLTFECKNLFMYSLSDATVIFVFGMPKAIKQKLAEKINRECRPGTRIISYSFHLRGVDVPFVTDKPDPTSLSLYCYTIPS